MFFVRWWHTVIGTDNAKRKNESSWSSSSSSLSLSFPKDNDDQQLTSALLVADGDKDHVHLEHVQNHNEHDDSSSSSSSGIARWCSDGRLAIILLNGMMLIRGLFLVVTVVCLEGAQEAMNMNHPDGNSNNSDNTTTATTTIKTITTTPRIMLILIMNMMIFVIPFIVGLLGAIYYNQHMVVFALFGFLSYIVLDTWMMVTPEVCAYFALIRAVCYFCMASIFIKELRDKTNNNNNNRNNNNTQGIQNESSIDKSCHEEHDTISDHNHEHRYVAFNV